MRILVRADSDETIGSGHVIRCLAVIDRLELAGAHVELITTGLSPTLTDVVVSRGWTITTLATGMTAQEDAECTARVALREPRPAVLLLDHYSLDAAWERVVHSHVDRLMVIDDLADRPHSCDILMDPTLLDSHENRHQSKTRLPAEVFLGPEFAPVRPEFLAIPRRSRDGGVNRLLVFLGGATSAADLLPLLDALTTPDLRHLQTVIVLGAAFPDPDAVKGHLTGGANIAVIHHTNDMPHLLDWADLAIGATGGAQWERCAVGLPTLTVLTADNQEHDVEAFGRSGATVHLGRLEEMTSERWHDGIARMIDDPARIAHMGQAAGAILDGAHDGWVRLRAAILDPAPSDAAGDR